MFNLHPDRDYSNFTFSVDEEEVKLRLKILELDINTYKDSNGVSQCFLYFKVSPHKDDIEVFRKNATDLNRVYRDLETNQEPEEDTRFTHVVLPRDITGSPITGKVTAEVRNLHYMDHIVELEFGVFNPATTFMVIAKL